MDVEGDDITIEETPNGCVICQRGDEWSEVQVSSPKDARILIDSLARMMESLSAK